MSSPTCRMGCLRVELGEGVKVVNRQAEIQAPRTMPFFLSRRMVRNCHPAAAEIGFCRCAGGNIAW